MGSFEGFLMVYRDTKLAWTTKLPGVPVFVSRASFQGVDGLIVSLDDTGLLSISYLGTDKMSQADIGKLHQNESKVDYLKLEQQHLAIMEKIRMQETEQVK